MLVHRVLRETDDNIRDVLVKMQRRQARAKLAPTSFPQLLSACSGRLESRPARSSAHSASSPVPSSPLAAPSSLCGPCPPLKPRRWDSAQIPSPSIHERQGTSGGGSGLDLFNLSNFRDASSPEARPLSAPHLPPHPLSISPPDPPSLAPRLCSPPQGWELSGLLRTYALFLEERVACFEGTGFDPDSERTTSTAIREWNTVQLVEKLPKLQLLLRRLVAVVPAGSGRVHPVVAAAVAQTFRDSKKVYRAISDGIVNLVDRFFDMPQHDAAQARVLARTVPGGPIPWRRPSRQNRPPCFACRHCE